MFILAFIIQLTQPIINYKTSLPSRCVPRKRSISHALITAKRFAHSLIHNPCVFSIESLKSEGIMEVSYRSDHKLLSKTALYPSIKQYTQLCSISLYLTDIPYTFECIPTLLSIYPIHTLYTLYTCPIYTRYIYLYLYIPSFEYTLICIPLHHIQPKSTHRLPSLNLVANEIVRSWRWYRPQCLITRIIDRRIPLLLRRMLLDHGRNRLLVTHHIRQQKYSSITQRQQWWSQSD